jgi:uncharacterized protein (TIGR02996 family)
MDIERTLLSALHADPADQTCWLALGDWLEESDQTDRAELLRLRLALQDLETRSGGPAYRCRADRERRLRRLLERGVPPVVPVLVNSIGMELALVPAGTFWMGSPEGEPGRYYDEDPRHKAQITRAFYLGVYPVTQAQYQGVTGTNPSHFRDRGEGAPLVRAIDTGNFPVECVSWHDAVELCARLSALPAESSAGRVYRLPTEAEWEYACRAGTTTLFHYGDALSSDLANFDGTQPEGNVPRSRNLKRTCAVGSYPPNVFGLYDMHGNVWEWCHDWFDESYYSHSPARDPAGPAAGSRRALRGGGWFYGAKTCRSAFRYRYEPHARHYAFGVRVALTAG